MANPETQLQAIVFWTMGDISSISLEQLGFIAVPVTICSVILFLKSWDLNYFCFVDSEAKSMGFNIGRNRILFLACATVLVASAVSVSGSIGWVGLVIPQLVRLLIGTNNRYAMPLSFLMGSSFLLLVDIINRLISAAELPVSILSGLLGLPLFVVCWFVNAKHREEQSR
jgi:iron complex transport system permease protein